MIAEHTRDVIAVMKKTNAAVDSELQNVCKIVLRALIVQQIVALKESLVVTASRIIFVNAVVEEVAVVAVKMMKLMTVMVVAVIKIAKNVIVSLQNVLVVLHVQKIVENIEILATSAKGKREMNQNGHVKTVPCRCVVVNQKSQKLITTREAFRHMMWTIVKVNLELEKLKAQKTVKLSLVWIMEKVIL